MRDNQLLILSRTSGSLASSSWYSGMVSRGACLLLLTPKAGTTCAPFFSTAALLEISWSNQKSLCQFPHPEEAEANSLLDAQTSRHLQGPNSLGDFQPLQYWRRIFELCPVQGGAISSCRFWGFNGSLCLEPSLQLCPSAHWQHRKQILAASTSWPASIMHTSTSTLVSSNVHSLARAAAAAVFTSSKSCFSLTSAPYYTRFQNRLVYSTSVKHKSLNQGSRYRTKCLSLSFRNIRTSFFMWFFKWVYTEEKILYH